MAKSELPLNEKIAALFRYLSKPDRVNFLLAIGEGEACVCHLEALSGLRQAYISQHLMALRRAGILTTRRDGRYIFYRLADPALLGLLRQAGDLAGVPPVQFDEITVVKDGHVCPCPNCQGEAVTVGLLQVDGEMGRG